MLCEDHLDVVFADGFNELGVGRRIGDETAHLAGLGEEERRFLAEFGVVGQKDDIAGLFDHAFFECGLAGVGLRIADGG